MYPIYCKCISNTGPEELVAVNTHLGILVKGPWWHGKVGAPLKS